MRRLAVTLAVVCLGGLPRAGWPHDAPVAARQAADAASAQAAGARADRRTRLVLAGELALSQGDPAAALARFEEAAAISHAADIELGIVRSHLQAGEYRRALAFCAHTAGAHPESPAGALLYIWLLHLGAQSDPARRLLDQTLERFPSDPRLLALRRLLSGDGAVPGPELLSVPARLAPYSVPALPAARARVVGTATLINAGRHALVPLSLLPEGARWVRNGLGQLSPITLERRLGAIGLALVRLHKPLPFAGPLIEAPRDAFPGSPAFAPEFTPARGGVPAWPILRVGFIGPASPAGDRRELGVTMPRGPRGGPVFDVSGRLAGIAIRGPARGDQLIPVRLLRETGVVVTPDPRSIAQDSRVAADEIYERAMRSTLQVIAKER